MDARVRPRTRPHRRRTVSRRQTVGAVLAAGALLLVAGGAVALLAPAPVRAPVASVGQASTAAAVLVLLAGLTLVAAGSVAWFGRRDRGLAVIAFSAAAAWLAAELAGSASVAREARSAGALLAPLLAPLVLHLPIRSLRADVPRSLLWWAIVAVYAAAAACALGHSLSYDPFYDLHCSPVCSRDDNLLLLVRDMRLARLLQGAGLLVTCVAGLVLAAWSVGRLARGRPDRRRQEWPVLVPSIALGLSLTSWTAVRMAMTPMQPADPLVLAPALAAAVCLGLLGVGVTTVVAIDLRRTEALHRLVDALEAAEGSASLRAALARSLGDPTLRVAYPVEGGGFIDDQGEAAVKPRSGDDRAVTTIQRRGAPVAFVEHDAGLDPDLLGRQIGAAACLAVDNERLEATIRARLRELRASRARIVAAADGARGWLERDLHDGAQQRLLALSFELRLAAAALVTGDAIAGSRATIDRALDETEAALAELRELAHGIHPVVLTEDGLMGALASLADTSSVPINVDGDDPGRCAAPAELAAYMAAVAVSIQAEAQGVERVDVSVGRDDGAMRLSIRGAHLDERERTRVEDRVGAAGGRMEVRSAADGVAGDHLLLELPCR